MTVLRTFRVPGSPSDADAELGQEMIRAWQSDGIFQVATTPELDVTIDAAYAASKRFFRQPYEVKAGHVSDVTYSGYIASGEEVTAAEADYSEIFTLTKDVGSADPRVLENWPCHGPVPWPDKEYQQAMQAYLVAVGALGDRLLHLAALGLRLPDLDAFAEMSDDGWHHMRVLRFPAETPENGGRGIGAHTDYGLLVIASQDDVGGLYVRPPIAGEHRKRNWLKEESTAGMYEADDLWEYVKPVPNVLTVFPGDIMEFLTGGALLSTPHKVRLAARERFALAYFHEPNFQAVARPLNDPSRDAYIHYGTHFTSMFMRCYPDRVTTRRIEQENRLEILQQLREKALAG